MPLDVYSTCPGGTGKKIKFCCTDLLGDLQKIERMLEGEQYQACLSHIERLEPKYPGRACLLSTKCMLLRASERLEEAVATVEEFRRLHPKNPIALAESAILTAAQDGGQAAMPFLQEAMAACEGEIPLRIGEMMITVGQVLLLEGHALAARAVLQWAAALDRENPAPMELLVRINASGHLPIWVKDERRLIDCPADAPWKGQFDAATAAARRGLWAVAEKQLMALVEQVGDQPAIWRNVAMLRGWLADHAGAVEALRKFAALDVPWEDASEAEAVALFLSDDPLGDNVDVLSLTYAVNDPERLQTAAASATRMKAIRPDLEAFAAEGEPPPLGVYVLFSRPVPAAGAELSLENVPRLLCQAYYFGRQTDRDARLEIHPVAEGDLPIVQSVLAESFADALGPIVKQEVTEHVPRTQELLARNWPLPRETSRETTAALVRRFYEEALWVHWPALPLGILDGKSPQEASADPRWRARLLAAILLIEFWTEQSGTRFDFNTMRSKFGLPTLDAIDPEQVDVELLPATRLSRLQTEKLSDDTLLKCLHRTLANNLLVAVRAFGRAWLERPTATNQEERLRICSVLARVEDNSERALFCVDEGRKIATAVKQSSAPWDLIELSLRYARGDEGDVERLWRHISTEHIREPGVAAALQEWLMQIGAIGPDGRPTMQASAAQQPAPAVATPAGPEPGKLWTPGGESTSQEKPKLWTPGM